MANLDLLQKLRRLKWRFKLLFSPSVFAIYDSDRLLLVPDAEGTIHVMGDASMVLTNLTIDGAEFPMDRPPNICLHNHGVCATTRGRRGSVIVAEGPGKSGD